ncbi:hypothetical protein ACF1BP_24255 [Streptomyces sp. NPDC014735]|uniref:hypothetical protein n=1 Tax=Streptomyces sp. NPDC014735 TaxID=3364887 RepID=UPI0036F65D6B
MTQNGEGEVPVPLPGDTARLDQLAAHWRDADPAARQEVTDAADALLDSPDAGAVDQLLDALRRAGINPDADNESL